MLCLTYGLQPHLKKNLECRLGWFADLVFNKLKLPPTRAYFITWCDGMQFDDSTAGVIGDTQFIA